MGISLSELHRMTMREFQYCVNGYDARERNKRILIANLATMIVNPKSIRQFMRDNQDEYRQPVMTSIPDNMKMTGAKYIPLSQVKTKEELAAWNKMVDDDFRRVRESPTYRKREIAVEQMYEKMKDN